MSRRAINVWVWIIATIPFLGWGLSGLMDLDEGFYGAIAAEMNRRGEWLIPLFNGKPWFEKPILIYWLTKPSIAVFGFWWGPRLPSIVASVSTLIIVYWVVSRRDGRNTGNLSVLVLATSLFFVAVGRYLLCDPLLVFCLTATFLLFWESLHSDPKWRILAAFFLGLSVLAKGPVGCALFVAVAGYTYWREKPFRSSFRGHWISSILVFSAVVSSWYVPAYLRAGQSFVQGFLVDQNIKRFQGGDAAHHVGGALGLVYYLPIVLLGMLPWSIKAIQAWPRRGLVDDETASLRRYLATWIVAVLALFTIAGSKLPTYALPAFPPMAILAAIAISHRKGDLTAKRLVGYALGAVVIGVFLTGGFWWYWQVSGQAEAQKLARYIKLHAHSGDAFVEYDMSGARPSHLKLAGKTNAPGPIPINRTSLPSLLMYAGRDCVFLDKPAQLQSLNQPAWIIARIDGISLSKLPTELRDKMQLVSTGKEPQNFELYYLKP